MATLILALLLLVVAPPAWGVGDAGEVLCANPGAGVTCTCTEPLTYNDGIHESTSWNPGGSSDNECNKENGGEAAMTGGMVLGTDWTTRETADTSFRSVKADGSDSTLTPGLPLAAGHGTSGYVLRSLKGVWPERSQINDSPTVTFTNGSYCTRRYWQFDLSNDCGPAPDNKCNFKGPRYEGPDPGDHPGSEQSNNYTTPKHRLGSYQGPNIGACVASTPGSGCCGSGACPIGTDGLVFERMQTGWVSWEICFDHNFSQAQVEGPGGINDLYDGDLIWPGSNRAYLRARMVMINGPYAGDEVYFLGVAPNSVGTMNSGTVMRHYSNFVGSQDTEINGPQAVAFVMATHKAVADPAYWIGPAQEIAEEGGAGPSEPTGVLAWQP